MQFNASNNNKQQVCVLFKLHCARAGMRTLFFTLVVVVFRQLYCNFLRHGWRLLILQFCVIIDLITCGAATSIKLLLPHALNCVCNISQSLLFVVRLFAEILASRATNEQISKKRANKPMFSQEFQFVYLSRHDLGTNDYKIIISNKHTEFLPNVKFSCTFVVIFFIL